METSDGNELCLCLSVVFIFIFNYVVLFKRRQHGSRKNGSFVINVEGESASGGGSSRKTPTSSWAKMVLDLYPPGTSLRFFKESAFIITRKQVLLDSELFHFLFLFCNLQKFDLRLLSCGAGKTFQFNLLFFTMFC